MTKLHFTTGLLDYLKQGHHDQLTVYLETPASC